jgi:hypothetical protein
LNSDTYDLCGIAALLRPQLDRMDASVLRAHKQMIRTERGLHAPCRLFAGSICAQIEIEALSCYFIGFFSGRGSGKFLVLQAAVSRKCAARAHHRVEGFSASAIVMFLSVVSIPKVCMEHVGCNVAECALRLIDRLGSSFSSAHVIES